MRLTVAGDRRIVDRRIVDLGTAHRCLATGMATDSIAVVCRPGSSVPFAGPATRRGRDIARAAHRVVLRGALAERADLRTELL